MVEIIPSILAADFARLGEQIAQVERGGATMLHLDVMDGHFVQNLTIGPPVVASIRKITRLTLDIHLMITDPDKYAPLFIDAGADQVLVHQEACKHLDGTLREIQRTGARAGVVINPATPLSAIDEVLGLVDYVLIMSVNPGFGGQEFIPYALDKVRRLDAIRRERRLYDLVPHSTRRLHGPGDRRFPGLRGRQGSPGPTEWTYSPPQYAETVHSRRSRSEWRRHRPHFPAMQ